MAAAARPLVSLLAAVADNGVIGRDNALPWRLPDDLKRFKALTLGKPVLMGRKTFDSIGRALPERTNLVLTRAASWSHPGTIAVASLDAAVARAAGAPELIVIGGAEIYRLALPRAHRIYLTRVHAVVAGDTSFPSLDAGEWRETQALEHRADERHAYAMTFVTLERDA
jgi:dihydrofolate reductase